MINTDKLQEIAKMVRIKNLQYGNSFSKTSRILQIMYPTGIRPSEYHDVSLVVRILDKLNRIANGHMEDSAEDIIGYCLLMIKEAKT